MDRKKLVIFLVLLATAVVGAVLAIRLSSGEPEDVPLLPPAPPERGEFRAPTSPPPGPILPSAEEE